MATSSATTKSSDIELLVSESSSTTAGWRLLPMASYDDKDLWLYSSWLDRDSCADWVPLLPSWLVCGVWVLCGLPVENDRERCRFRSCHSDFDHWGYRCQELSRYVGWQMGEGTDRQYHQRVKIFPVLLGMGSTLRLPNYLAYWRCRRNPRKHFCEFSLVAVPHLHLSTIPWHWNSTACLHHVVACWKERKAVLLIELHIGIFSYTCLII